MIFKFKGIIVSTWKIYAIIKSLFFDQDIHEKIIFKTLKMKSLLFFRLVSVCLKVEIYRVKKKNEHGNY